MLAGTLALATGAVGVLMVPLAIERLGLGDPGVGFLTTMMSIGFIVGAGVSVAFASRHRLAFGMLAAAGIYGIGAAGFGLATVTTTAVVAAVIYGAGMTLLDVLGRTLLQRATADELLTRVFGAVEALWLLGIAVGAAVAPPVASAIGLEWGFVVMAGVVLVAAVIALPSLRAADDAAVVPERQLELLAGIPMFQPLPRLDLERIAGQLDRLPVAAGTDVIRQGDVGDRFYVVDAGTFAILVDGRQIDETTEGGYFGEIALLHDVPRTATVRAITEAAVWALDQEEFLATITGLPQSAHAAHAISQERLRTHEDP
jgi:MFS family permease